MGADVEVEMAGKFEGVNVVPREANATFGPGICFEMAIDK